MLDLSYVTLCWTYPMLPYVGPTLCWTYPTSPYVGPTLCHPMLDLPYVGPTLHWTYPMLPYTYSTPSSLSVCKSSLAVTPSASLLNPQVHERFHLRTVPHSIFHTTLHIYILFFVPLCILLLMCIFGKFLCVFWQTLYDAYLSNPILDKLQSLVAPWA